MRYEIVHSVMLLLQYIMNTGDEVLLFPTQ